MTTRRSTGPLRAVAALAASLGLVGASAMDVSKIPLRLAFDVSGEGNSAQTLFDVREDALYAVNLTFFYDDAEHPSHDRSRVWHSVGGAERDPQTGQWQEPGAPLAVEVTLQRQDGGEAADLLRKRVDQPKLSSWGEGVLTARLVVTRLTPGRYRLAVRSLQAAPALQDVRAAIGVVRAYAGK